MTAMADGDEAAAALANRIAKRRRWVEAIHESSKYKTVHAVIMAGKATSLPEDLPDTPRHAMARSKRHWEGLCRRYRHCLQRLYDFIHASAELRMIVGGESTHQQGSSLPTTTGDSILSCFQC